MASNGKNLLHFTDISNSLVHNVVAICFVTAVHHTFFFVVPVQALVIHGDGICRKTCEKYLLFSV